VRRTLLLGAALVVLTACRQEELTVIPPSEFPPEVSDVYRATPSASPDQGSVPASATVYLIGGGRLVPVDRDLSPAAGLPEALLGALLEGPASRSAIPPDTRVLSVGVVGDVATVDLSEEFEQGASGSDLALRVAQVVYTLTEDPEVHSVLFAIEGTQRPVIAGNQRDVLRQPVTREDYAPFEPQA